MSPCLSYMISTTRRQALKLGAATTVVAATTTLATIKIQSNWQVFAPPEIVVLQAVAITLFPPGVFSLDGITAQVAENVDNLASELGPLQQLALRTMLSALEDGTLVSRGRAFTALPPRERTQVLNTWLKPQMQPRRLAAQSLQVLAGMAYFGHPQILKEIGWYTPCLTGSK